MKYFVQLLVSAFCCAIVSASIRPLEPNRVRLETRDDGIKYRLPNNTIPETYDISLSTSVHKGQFNFTGRVAIKFRVIETSRSVSLHFRQLTITGYEIVFGSNGGNVKTGDGVYDVATEIFEIPTKTDLVKDQEYTLIMRYNGTLRGENGADLKGFYRSSYKDAEGNTRWLATTQFESTDARHAFPCYDEPALKANFTIRIEHDQTYTAVSNMPATRGEVDSDGLVTTDFATTPPVSTYLIAFLVSDFEYAEKNASETNPTHQRVYTNKNNLGQTSYALEEGVNTLNKIADYLEVKFTLPKMDQAAIPDFSAGAMENWGLVTYREQYLLFDPTIHLPSRKLKISTIIAHEFGHQWFGDLVSPKWWTYIWLNEGFATLFEHLGVSLVHSEWDIFSYFVTNQLQPVLKSDARDDTRPMNTYQESPNGISNLFDSVAYQKAGSVIRMFMHALGESTFKKGLKYYLEENAYKAADEDNLFAALDKAAKEDKVIDESLNVKDLFGSWSNQKGFPVLIVTRNSNGTVTLKQQKYDAVNKGNETELTTWWIPYNFASAQNAVFNVTTPSGWIPKDTEEQLLTPDNTTTWKNEDWLLFNRQQTGFYRVLYDGENYDKVNKELNDGDINKIHPISRSQYIDDLTEFVNSGRIEPKILGTALRYLSKEKEYAPWVAAKQSINGLKQIFAVSDKWDQFRTFVVDLVTPVYKNTTLEATNENESVFNVLLRNIVHNLACEYGEETCLNATATKFKQFIENSANKPKPYHRGIIFANGIRSASSEEIDKFFAFYVSTDLAEERAEAVASFGNLQNDVDIERILNNTVQNTNANFKKSDRLALIQSIANGGQKGLSLTIKLVQQNLDSVNSTIGSINTILNTIAKRIATSQLETEFTALLDVAKEKGLPENDYDTLKGTASERVRWQNDHVQSFENGFFNSGSESGSSWYWWLLGLVIVAIVVAIIFVGVRKLRAKNGA